LYASIDAVPHASFKKMWEEERTSDIWLLHGDVLFFMNKKSHGDAKGTIQECHDTALAGLDRINNGSNLCVSSPTLTSRL
jgi:hypothetical protein